MQKLLENPQFMKIAVTAAIGTLLFCFVLLVGFLLYRKLRQELHGDSMSESSTRISENNSAFSLAAYEGVIRRLKEQEKELERLRKSERERASESASMSEAVLSNLSSGVILFNTASLVRQANPAARTLLGYASPTGLHARDAFKGVGEVRFPILAPGDTSLSPFTGLVGAGVVVAAVDLAARQGQSFRRLEADYMAPDGTARVLGITVSPVKGPGGEGQGAAVLVSDLTEITHLSRQVRLRESMAALGEMSAGIAHEFKNSLATISGYAQMLNADENDADGTFAAKIAAETSSLTRIVNDFLNFARPQGLDREAVDLMALLQDCARERSVHLIVKPEGSQLVVEGDPTALRQAFSNLFRNAAEAVGDEARAAVTVEVLQEPEIAKLRFSDNGPGIPSQILPRIFVPFFTTKSGGTGLGLALVHRILAEHEGSIQVDSGASGTTFTLTLPRRKNPGISG